jgi:hypothetical protein
MTAIAEAVSAPQTFGGEIAGERAIAMACSSSPRMEGGADRKFARRPHAQESRDKRILAIGQYAKILTERFGPRGAGSDGP